MPSAQTSFRRPVTIADVAARAGVSQMTVSRVVNGSAQVADATRRRVELAVADLGFVPSQLARSLSTGSLALVAFVLPDLTHPWFTAIAHSLESSAAEAGLTVVIGNTDGDPEQEARQLEKLKALRVDGVILAPAADSSIDTLRGLYAQGFPFVLVDREVPGIDADLVTGESRRAAADLVDHLVSHHGRRRVAVVAGPEGVSTSRERVTGWRTALRAAGLPAPQDLVRHADYTVEGGNAATVALLDGSASVDGLLASNAQQAFGALEALAARGLSVPGDVSVVSFDDVEAHAAVPFLTCAERSPREIGQEALRLLLRRTARPDAPSRRTTVEAELVVRRSCGCGTPPS